MNVSVLQENLQKAITRSSRIVSPRPTVPVLSTVLVQAREGAVSITASSLETTETVLVAAKVATEGALCVPAKLFSELVLSLPAGTVTLEEKEGALRVSCAGVRASVAALPGSEFPPPGEADGKGGVLLGKEEFVRGLSLVLFAAATDADRPLLTGVKMVSGEGGVTLAATDGYRLSVYRSSLALPSGLNIVVPARTLGEVVRVCQEEKDAKGVSFVDSHGGQVAIRLGDTTIVTRQIDGTYPNFEKTIPTKHTTKATTDGAALARAVKSASIFARDSANIVRLHVGSDLITVSANAPQVGENTVDVDAKTQGDEADIAFNSRFLLDLLANAPGEELVFEMTGALNPGVFTFPKDPAFLHLIMPVRIQA